jgi:hypothetical protein
MTEWVTLVWCLRKMGMPRDLSNYLLRVAYRFQFETYYWRLERVEMAALVDRTHGAELRREAENVLCAVRGFTNIASAITTQLFQRNDLLIVSLGKVAYKRRAANIVAISYVFMGKEEDLQTALDWSNNQCAHAWNIRDPI